MVLLLGEPQPDPNAITPDLKPWYDMGLTAPLGFWVSSLEERSSICNGAGAAGGVSFPNTFYGLSVKVVFDIHDWDYHAHGDKSPARRHSVDMRMLANSLRVIEGMTTSVPLVGHLLRALRRRRALKYYEAVRAFGDAAFHAPAK